MLRLSLCVTLSLVLVFLPRQSRAQEGNEYGLRFVSHEDIKDNRTSLLITPDDGLRLEGDFTLAFDVKLHGGVQTFGYVFRMIFGDTSNLDMISEVSAGSPTIRFVEGHEVIAEFPVTFLPDDPLSERWTGISVEARPGRGEVTLTVDSLSQTVPVRFGAGRCKIWFGVCDHPSFYSTDVPPMSLRDVRVTSAGGKLFSHWELRRHSGEVTLDLSGRHPAVAKNPVWLLDGYAHWQRRISALIPEKYLGVAPAADQGVIYFAAGNHLAVYDNSRPEWLEVRETSGPMPFTVMPDQIVFDSTRRLLVAYEFESRSTATLAPDGDGPPEWSQTPPLIPATRYWHHNAAFIPGSGDIVTFGGYGEHRYKAQMNIIDPAGGWESMDLADSLPPRYLSGMAVTADGKLLIAGGYGSISGLQSESPRNFYDIHSVDPATGLVANVGEIVHDRPDEHFVFGRDMIPSDDGGWIYAIVYSDKRYASEIQLAGIDLSTGRMVRYADPIPYRFSDIESFCTLAFDRARGEFLLVTARQEGDEGTMLEIWSLQSPPLQIADTVQVSRRRGMAWWFVSSLVLVLAGVATAIVLSVRIRRRPEQSAQPAPAIPDYHNTYRVEKKPSSILLLGGFQVVDKKGNDITGHFTQTVKALFLLILLETSKNGRGISSHMLSDILWFDKDSDNARNNRNVNIHKLRSMLAEVGEADVSSSNSYWHLRLGEGIFCDYGALLHASGAAAGGDRAQIERLVALASLGKLLPDVQTEWSDAYKADFSARLIEQLMKAASSPAGGNDPQLTLRIAEAILTHDNLDEDAMRMKCLALVRMGKKNQAKQAYDSFVADFKKALDTRPDFNFADIFDINH